jgi:ankyrin repeat protein
MHAQVDLLDYLVRALGADLSARVPVYTTNYAPHSLSGAIYAMPTTALHAAALELNEAVTRRLIELGADVNAVDRDSASPLHYAARNPTSTPAVVRLLLGHGSETETEDNWQARPLHLAAEWGNIEALKLLLVYGADVAVRRSSDFLPLHDAAERGLSEAVVLLGEGGSDVNARTVTGWRPLDIAENNGFDQIAEYLKAKGAVTRFVV